MYILYIYINNGKINFENYNFGCPEIILYFIFTFHRSKESLECSSSLNE